MKNLSDSVKRKDLKSMGHVGPKSEERLTRRYELCVEAGFALNGRMKFKIVCRRSRQSLGTREWSARTEGNEAIL